MMFLAVVSVSGLPSPLRGLWTHSLQTKDGTYLALIHVLLVETRSHRQRSVYIRLVQGPNVLHRLVQEGSKPSGRGSLCRILHQDVDLDAPVLQILPQGRDSRVVRDVKRPDEYLDGLAGLLCYRVNFFLRFGQDSGASACDDDPQGAGLSEGFRDRQANAACATSSSVGLTVLALRLSRIYVQGRYVWWEVPESWTNEE